MAFTYTKLSCSITESSIWCEPDGVRLVWITMLAMSDKNGKVEASIPGLAARARVSIAETEAAIQKFLSPDPYSRTPDYEGRRIEVVPRGWRLLNHRLYRGLQDAEDRREYYRTHKAEKRSQKKAAPVQAVQAGIQGQGAWTPEAIAARQRADEEAENRAREIRESIAAHA